MRQGIANGQPALELAQKVASSKHAKFEGYMAYSGGASHTKGWEARRQKSAEDLAGFRKRWSLSGRPVLPVNIVTGGSTGTYNIDKTTDLTELECGSYVFMDTAYSGSAARTTLASYSDFDRRLQCLPQSIASGIPIALRSIMATRLWPANR